MQNSQGLTWTYKVPISLPDFLCSLVVIFWTSSLDTTRAISREIIQNLRFLDSLGCLPNDAGQSCLWIASPLLQAHHDVCSFPLVWILCPFHTACRTKGACLGPQFAIPKDEDNQSNHAHNCQGQSEDPQNPNANGCHEEYHRLHLGDRMTRELTLGERDREGRGGLFQMSLALSDMSRGRHTRFTQPIWRLYLFKVQLKFGLVMPHSPDIPASPIPKQKQCEPFLSQKLCASPFQSQHEYVIGTFEERLFFWMMVHSRWLKLKGFCCHSNKKPQPHTFSCSVFLGHLLNPLQPKLPWRQ